MRDRRIFVVFVNVIEHGILGSQEGKKDVTPRTSQYTTSAAAAVINGDNYTTVW